ncbi:hypothetical protein [Sphingobacterium pedocola]|uniref:Lipoprotein n=1 Tax=Sphingobacterium pedocola TaxID=2082722 RepID=A0ABR9T2T8_9SPHI|nr:hypothetical protein [Sphingobacterium pedocola]MBE8719668.1 hypothetical protein [Sphingobacterium pedocola]
MNRYVVFTVLLSVLFFGCKKDREDSDRIKGFVHFKLNGQEMKHDAHVSGNDPPSEEIVHFVTIYGSGEPGPNDRPPVLDFQLVHDEVKEGGQYTSANSELHANYSSATFAGGAEFTSTRDGGFFELRVTELGYYGVKGTFSGRLLSDADQVINITDGTFEAPYNYR